MEKCKTIVLGATDWDVAPSLACSLQPNIPAKKTVNSEKFAHYENNLERLTLEKKNDSPFKPSMLHFSKRVELISKILLWGLRNSLPKDALDRASCGLQINHVFLARQ